ncbi:MAG: peroxiredoxin [Candidatus Sungbacteria bacterium]|uniref:Peroxiredoxin n=1 Tax=Candidatus Sungiibacteriota bacterium TaxID=2750080 RepID=A0A933DU62_9BACT|nr:peroxiredoxin [Candidatus Sungbacteria bacterium]
MFAVDQRFPSFSLETYFPERDEVGHLNSRDFAGKWLILFWYPKDFTFVCPTELADLQARHEEFRAQGAEVLSVSTDTVYTHKGWVEAEKLLSNLKFAMAADHNARLARELSIYDEPAGVAQRAAFIIDPDGVLRAADIVSDAIGRSAGELVRKLKALKFVREHPGKVCPASWDEGSPTIAPSIKIAGKVHGAISENTS